MKLPNKPNKRIAQILQIAGAALLIGVYLWLSQAEKPAVTTQGTVVGRDIDLSAYTLTDHNGHDLKLNTFAGKWVVLFFGYTHCPDVCPTTLAYLRKEFAGLLENRKFAQVVMVSVDPGRDDPATLKSYVQAFDPAFIGASGDPSVLDSLVKVFGGFIEKNKADSAIGYTIQHPGDIFIISPHGQWHSVYRPPLVNNVLKDDLRHLILRQQS